MESTLARLVENCTTNVSQLEMSQRETATDCVDKERYLRETNCGLPLVCCGYLVSNLVNVIQKV